MENFVKLEAPPPDQTHQFTTWFFSVALNLEDFYHQVNKKRKTFQEALNVSEIYMLNNWDNKITSLSHHNFRKEDTESAFTFSKLAIET